MDLLKIIARKWNFYKTLGILPEDQVSLRYRYVDVITIFKFPQICQHFILASTFDILRVSLKQETCDMPEYHNLQKV